jgi:hypothetical protein
VRFQSHSLRRKVGCQNSLPNARSRSLSAFGCREARGAPSMQRYSVRGLKGPAAVVPSLCAIGPGRDLSLGDARSAFQRVIWNIECEIVLSDFGYAFSIRIYHGRNARLEDLRQRDCYRAPRARVCAAGHSRPVLRNTDMARERCNDASMLFLFGSLPLQATNPRPF